MKHKIWLYHLISAVFAFVLAVSAIGNLATGYDLPIESFWNILLWCAIFALGTSVIFRFRYGGWILLCVAAAAGLLLWNLEATRLQIQQQTACIGYMISDHYNNVYDWPVFGNPSANDVSLPLIFWASLVTVGVNWYFCRRKHIVIVLLPAVIPLVLCLITTDRVPDVICLYLFILCIAVLLITDWTRRRHPTQGLKLLLPTALPIAVALALLFTLNPREEYVNNAGKIQKEVVSLFQEFQDAAESVANGTPITAPVSEKLNLRTVGPKSKLSHSVMRVNSPIGGTIYLRGRDYDVYNGTGWEASSERNEDFTSGGASAGELTIVTYGVRNILYVPYYATKEINLVGGACENDENLQRYGYYVSQIDFGNSVTPDSRYTKLPADTLVWAKELSKEITDGASTDRERILRIQNYVRNSAVYDLSTSRMDSEYNDFAQWFLEESETGYCVHFATATTVLLRAAGIPARYVEGYMVRCNPKTAVVVTNQDAHAWAEYYDSDAGAWRILEATPADSQDEEIEPTLIMPETEATLEETQAETDDSDSEPSEAEDTLARPTTSAEELPGMPPDSTGKPEGQDKEKESFRLPEWTKTVFKCLLFAACIPLQGYARICWKRRLWNLGRPNELTLTRWRQTRSLAKLLKQQYPEELDSLAYKAKFSQHRIQPEELQQFEDYRIALTELLCCKPWYHRIFFKWILAID